MSIATRIKDALRSALYKRAGLVRVLALVLSIVALAAATPSPAEACGISDPLSCVAMIFVKIFQLLTALMGWILVLEVEALIRVAQYFNFVSPGPSAVQIGWVVTRDVANMFFIVVLLIIAFGTILGSSTYHYSKNLPRLLIMAVVINFSKTICGIFIDMGQVVMLTFVNGFKETAAGNFMNAYQINKLLALGNSESEYTFGMVIAMMFAFILAAISVCVTLVLLVIVLFRVVMLWILIILSPIAFLTSAIPRGGDYYAKWWGEFKKYIMTGPIVAFFMWLALASVQSVGPGGFASQGFPPTYAGAGEAAAAQGTGQNKIATDAGTADTIMNMIIAICIMFAGLKYAADSGVAGSGVAKSVRGGLEKTGRAIATGGLKAGLQPVMTGGGKALARVPLVGGLGRAAVLTGEKWKKERQGFKEKFAGGAEDLARLSPGAFNRSLKSLSSKGNLDAIDKKRLDGMVRTGLADPKTAAAMGKSGDGAFAVDQLVRSSSGKGLQDAVGLMMSDKNVNTWAKNDPTFMASAYDKIKSAWKDKDGNVLDPNMGKTVADFEQKFAPKLVESGLMDASRLKELAPKMSGDDVMGLGKGDMATFMPYLTSNQMKKLSQDGTPDQQSAMLESLAKMEGEAMKDTLGKIGASDVPAAWLENDAVADYVLDKTRGDAKSRGDVLGKDKGGKLAARADARLANALGAGDAKAAIAAMPDAISVGSMKADKLLGDAQLRGYVDNNAGSVDLASLARSSGRMSSDQKEAAQALTAMVSAANPDLGKRMRGEMYQDIRPSAEMHERVSGGEKAAAATEQQAEVARTLGEFNDALAKAKEELAELENLATAPGQSTRGATSAVTQLQSVIDSLERAGNQRTAAQKEKTEIEVKLANTPASDGAATAALNKTLGEIEKTLEKTQQEIIKGMAALKGGGAPKGTGKA